MSGHKRATVSISEGEYRRLHDAEMKLRFFQTEQPEVVKQQKEQTVAVLRNNLNQVENRQQEFQLVLNDLQPEVRSVEFSAAQSVIQQQQRTIGLLQQAQDSLWESVGQELQKQSQEFYARIAYQHQQHQAEMSSLDSRLGTLEEDRQRKFNLALSWAQAAERLSRFIRLEYPHEYLKPGLLDQYDDELRQAYLNLEEDLPDVSLVFSQRVYSKVSNLRLELEQALFEWQVLQQACVDAAGQVLSLAGSVHTVPALDIDGNELEFQIDVNYWSSGQLGELADRVSSLLDELETSPFSRNPAELRQFIDVDAPQIRLQVQELVFQSRLSVLNSQIRINIADLVVRALKEQGFVLQDGEYQESDMRTSYSALVKDYQGDEVVIRVDPLPSDPGSSEVHLISLDRELRTDHELRQRSREISQSLENAGLQVDGSRTPSRRPSPFSLPSRQSQAEVVSLTQEQYR